MIDSFKRTLIKSISWKLSGFVILLVLTFIVTGSIKKTSLVALIYHGIMLVLYVIHEKMWNKILWGKTTGLFIQMTGMSGAGKSTLSETTARMLQKRGFKVEILDGDEYRKGLCADLGFSKKDRNTNIRRLGFVSKVLARNNVISIIAAINPYEDVRQEINKYGNVKTVFINCDIEELKKRDTKGLYKRAMLPDDHPEKVYNFTGISDLYDVPRKPDLVIDTHLETVEQSTKKLEKFIIENIL
jgi:adenylylsulfate kinase